MKALTLRQPWAWAVTAGHKRIENRTWPPTLGPGEVFAIHAGAAVPAAADVDTVRERLRGRAAVPDEFVRGAIVAVARVSGTVTASSDPWFTGPIGWVLEDVVPLVEPIPCRGLLGLWPVAPELGRDIRRQLAR